MTPLTCWKSTDKVQALVIDEDLLFYYLNLTLINSKITRTENYRKIMLNAINLHKKRLVDFVRYLMQQVMAE